MGERVCAVEKVRRERWRERRGNVKYRRKKVEKVKDIIDISSFSINKTNYFTKYSSKTVLASLVKVLHQLKLKTALNKAELYQTTKKRITRPQSNHIDTDKVVSLLWRS